MTAAERQTDAARVALAQALWSDAAPIEGTPVDTYLRRHRGLAPPWPNRPDMGWSCALCWHPAVPFSNDGQWRVGAMLAAVTDDAGGLTAVQATGLQPDGSGKIQSNAPRRTFGAPAGGAVRLFPQLIGDHTGALAIAEGVETAIGFALLSGYPTWAALGSANLKRFNPPLGVDELVIAADHDAAGLDAAQALAARWRDDIFVEIRHPSIVGRDWADEAAERRQEWAPDLQGNGDAQC